MKKNLYRYSENIESILIRGTVFTVSLWLLNVIYILTNYAKSAPETAVFKFALNNLHPLLTAVSVVSAIILGTYIIVSLSNKE